MPTSPRPRYKWSYLAAALVFGLAAPTVGCGALGAGRAIDEAEEIVDRLPCAPVRDADATKIAPCQASNRTLFFAVSAREHLAEARRRSNHGDHAQAERFAVLARKAAEESLRSQAGQ